jgi:hypothetical protein
MYARVALVSLLVTLLTSCGPLARGRGARTTGGGASAGFSAQCRGDFGASAAHDRFESFMLATASFHDAAIDTQSAMLDACKRMGRSLEMPEAQLDKSGTEGTRDVCRAVAEHIRSEMQAVSAGSQTTVELRAQPPRCEARFEAYAECAGRCDATITPGELEMRCEGGEIRGECSASCSGRCAVSVEASCQGICEGACEGTCSARAADGSCAGQCSGTCHGQCVADVTGECGGECRGSCSVEWQEPTCTGTYRAPEVSAECNAACDAQVDASVECQPGQAELVVSGGPDAETQARAAKLRAAVAEGYGAILAVRQRVERLEESGRAVLAQLQQLPNAIRDVGISAAACSAGALADIQESMAAVSVTLEVSVSVSASFSATAG